MDRNTSIRAIILNMKVGQIVSFTFAAARYATIRGYACELGLINNCKYETHINREARHYTVRRIS